MNKAKVNAPAVDWDSGNFPEICKQIRNAVVPFFERIHYHNTLIESLRETGLNCINKRFSPEQVRGAARRAIGEFEMPLLRPHEVRLIEDSCVAAVMSYSACPDQAKTQSFPVERLQQNATA